MSVGQKVLQSRISTTYRYQRYLEVTNIDTVSYLKGAIGTSLVKRHQYHNRMSCEKINYKCELKREAVSATNLESQ